MNISTANILLLIFVLCVNNVKSQESPGQLPFYSNNDPMVSKLSQLQFAEMPQMKGDKYPDVDAHRIISPLISPVMEVFEQMQENARARAQAEKIAKDREDHPFSSSKSLWEMFQRLQKPTTTTTPAPPLIERLLQPYIEPWQKQLDDFSKNMAGITLIPTTTTTPAPTTTSPPNLLEKSLSMFFPSLRRKPQSTATVATPTTTQTPHLFDPDIIDRIFFKREKRQAEIASIAPPVAPPTFDLFTVPPPPPIFQEWEKPILGLSNPFTLNPLMKMFTTGKPFTTTPPPFEKIDTDSLFPMNKIPFKDPQFKLQDPFYNPLFPNRKSKLFDILAGGEASRILG